MVVVGIRLGERWLVLMKFFCFDIELFLDKSDLVLESVKIVL